MLKRLHRVLLLVLMLVAFSSVPIIETAGAEPTGIPVLTEENSAELTFDNDVKVKDLDIDPINTDSIKKSVVPDTKKEGKKLIGLFIKVMMLVILSSLIVFIVLFLIKRFYGSTFVPSDEEYENAEMLELITPDTKSDALRSFLNRTK